MNKSSFSLKKFPHYARVVWYRVVRPHWWAIIVQKRVRSISADVFPNTINPLFFNIKEHSSQVKSLQRIIPREEILRQAEDATQHKFAIFSNTLREHGNNIEWHKDYASGKIWDSSKPSSELDFMTSRHGSDVKYAWDMNRCQWFTWLGMAYILENEAPTTNTNIELFAQAFKRDVESWQAANPLGQGINWAMPMEVAIRATNWIFAASFFHASPSLDGTFWQAFMRILWQHGQHLEYNLEYVRNNANHFMSNTMGLVVIGAFFQHVTSNIALQNFGQRLFGKGKALMEKEILRQFYEDGIQYEKSTSYHRFVTEMCTIAFAAAERVNSPFQDIYYERVRRAHEYIRTYSRSDGSAPCIGDTDNGRVLRYRASEDYNNHLQNLDFEHIFLTQSFFDASSSTINNTAYMAQYFPNGGFVVWRNKTIHLIADTGDYGMNGWGGHGHNDCLSFELWLHGHGIFIDSGTGFYTSNTAIRNELRSTKAHNTVMVENAEQTLYAGLWRIASDELTPQVTEYFASEQGMKLCAEHSGYISRFGVKHRRQFQLQLTNGGGLLEIIDTLLPQSQGITGVSGEVSFIVPKEVHITNISENTLKCFVQGFTFTMRNDAGFRVESCSLSLFYGDVREGQRIVILCDTESMCATEILWNTPTS